MSNAQGFLVINRAPDGRVENVFWPEFEGRLYTEAEARGSAEQDNMRGGSHYSEVVAVMGP